MAAVDILAANAPSHPSLSATNTIPLGNLADRSVLISFPIGIWRGLKTDKRIGTAGAASLAASSGQHVNAERVTSSRRLVAADRITKMEAKRSAYRKVWEHYTSPWANDGTRIALGAGLLPLKAKVSAFEDEWRILVADFVRDYPAMINESRTQLGPLFNVNDYPSVNRIAEHFSFRFIVTPLPNIGDWRTEGVSQSDLDAFRASTEAIYAETIAQAQRVAWARLAEPITHMVERLRGYTGAQKGSFQQSLMDNVAEVINLLPALNLTNDPMLTQFGELAKDLCLYDAETLRESATLREDTAAVAEALRTNMAPFM